MIHPRRVDGNPIRVVSLTDGRVFVDVEPEIYKDNGHWRQSSRGGPEHSRHFHRFDDYGLAEGLVRCRKCGLVKEQFE